MRIFDFVFSFIFTINLLFGSSFSSFNDSDKDKLLLEIIAYVIDKGHYSPKEMNDDFSKNVFNSYLEMLDGQHRFFLRADIDNFKRHETEIDNQLKSANIDFFNLTYNQAIIRVEQVKNFYPSLLEKPFDFSVKATTSLNYKNLPYAVNLSELKAIWRKRFKLSTLDRFVTKKEQELLKKSEDSSYIIKSDEALEKEARFLTLQNIDDYFEIVDEVDRKDYFNIFINSIVTEFDPHTHYLAPREKELFDTNMSGKYEGIGARLTKKQEKVKIVEVISGGPVWKNDLLQVGDEILMVAQFNEDPVDISGMRLDDSIKLIKGPKGTNVILTVKRVDGTIEDVIIERDRVVLEESYAKSAIISKNQKKFGLIELPKFYVDFKDYGERNAASDVKKALEQFKNNSIDGVVLDLRNNGGGSLKTVVDMTGYFIEQGPVVQVKSTGGKKEVLSDTDSSLIWDGPLVVLVNEFSASASEILAAALQDYRRAIILGSNQTYGKGTVQNVVDLNKIIAVNQYGDLGALKITTDKFYRINGGSTQLEGVKSDVVFPSRYNSIEIGEKDQSNPLEWDRISPANYSSWTRNIQYNYIISKSKDRIENNPLIKLILEQGEWIKFKQNDFDYHLDYLSYMSERDKDESYSKRFEILKDFNSGLFIKWLPDPFDVIGSEEDFRDRRDRWVKGLKKDMYIEEAVNILTDLNQNFNETLSLNQKQKNKFKMISN
ncbi:MAG: carboxy terminal-processing peptidase [Flavobacteriaceae bacterium]|nr:carboxy terminal-processing peptidase [Flavobacteriaceae bacterium]